MKVSDNSSEFSDEDAADAWGTLAGKRERAPVEGATDSSTPTQSIYKKSRLSDLHLALALEKEVEKRACAVAAAGVERKN